MSNQEETLGERREFFQERAHRRELANQVWESDMEEAFREAEKERWMGYPVGEAAPMELWPEVSLKSVLSRIEALLEKLRKRIW
jgi:hypothetical protein